MSRPSANIILSNGNLGGQGASANGVAALVVACAVAPVAGYGVPFLIKSIDQAKAAFAQVGNEPVVDAIVKGFFAEAPEGTELNVVALVNTNALTDLVASLPVALNFGAGKVRLASVIKFPANTYVPVVANGFDGDVHTAAIGMQIMADAWLANHKPFRALIQGYGYTGTANAVTDYTGVSGTKPNVGIVIGKIDGNNATATLLALGRASKVDPQRNIGRVKSGSLNIPETSVVTIGTAAVEAVTGTDLDTLHDRRYITFERNENAPGYIFNNDNMLAPNSNDFSSLRNGRVIDNAVRVAYGAYYEELKDDVEVDDNGRLDLVVEKALQTKIESKIDELMRGQLSSNQDGTAVVQCLVNPDTNAYAFLYSQNNITAPNFNILQTGKVYLFVRMRPKGSLQFINVYLGFVSATA